MKFCIIILVGIFLGHPTAAHSGGQSDDFDLAIVNAQIISPERENILEGATVLIRDGLIANIVGSTYPYKTKNTIDAKGQFLIPGLIDSHVHLYHATGLKQRYTKKFEVLYENYMDQLPRSFLYHGFTTVIETNADTQANDRFNKSPIHPDLKHCSAGLILSDGFMALEIPKGKLLEYAPNFLHDRFQNGYLPAGVDPNEHTPKATVAKIAESGAICIKLYFEEALWMPGGPPKFSLPSENIIREVVDEAHKLGLKVIIHATSPKGHEFARNTGIDILSHGPWDWNGNDYSAHEIPKDIQDNILATSLTEISVQPTISTLQQTASLFKPELLTDPDLENVLSKEYINYLRTEAQIQRDIFIEIFGPSIMDKPTPDGLTPIMLNMIKRYKNMVGLMSKNNINLILGTDTSSGGFCLGKPTGLTGYWEMKDWAESGVSLDRIFAAATINNAKSFGLDQEIGSIEIGKRANLLLLKNNPLNEIEAYNTIQTIFLNGLVIARDDLSVKRK